MTGSAARWDEPAGEQLQVGGAEADGAHPQERLAVGEHGIGHRREVEGLSVLPQDGRAHSPRLIICATVCKNLPIPAVRSPGRGPAAPQAASAGGPARRGGAGAGAHLDGVAGARPRAGRAHQRRHGQARAGGGAEARLHARPRGRGPQARPHPERRRRRGRLRQPLQRAPDPRPLARARGAGVRRGGRGVRGAAHAPGRRPRPLHRAARGRRGEHRRPPRRRRPVRAADRAPDPGRARGARPARLGLRDRPPRRLPRRRAGRRSPARARAHRGGAAARRAGHRLVHPPRRRLQRRHRGAPRTSST